MGDPGGGSDFAGFYNHLGIPIAEWGFGGQGGVYHSQYDSYAWMTKFGDPDGKVDVGKLGFFSNSAVKMAMFVNMNKVNKALYYRSFNPRSFFSSQEL